MPRATVNQLEIIRAAVALSSKRTIDHLLYIGDLQLPDEAFRGKPKARKKLAQAVVSEAQRLVIEASGVLVIPLPQYDLARSEKLKLAIVTGISRGLYREGDVVVGLLARRPNSLPDSISVVTVGPEDEDGAFSFMQVEGVSAEDIDDPIVLAVAIGVECREGRPEGALVVVVGAANGLEKARP